MKNIMKSVVFLAALLAGVVVAVTPVIWVVGWLLMRPVPVGELWTALAAATVLAAVNVAGVWCVGRTVRWFIS